MRAAIYARYSSDNQREESIEDQIRVAKQFAEQRGIAILEDHIYFDEAKSGSLHSRASLDRLLAAAEAKLFDAVIVDDCSRIARDNYYFNKLLSQFIFWNVQLISVSDGLDTREEHAKIGYQFRSIFNELYLADLKKKTKRGQEGQLLRGFNVSSAGLGYRSVPIGESKIDKKGRVRSEGFRLEIVPEEATTVRRLFEDFSAGIAVTAIVKRLNEEKLPTRRKRFGGWSVGTVARILKNEKYRGKFVWNRVERKTNPLTGKKVVIQRPECEWFVRQDESIRIISDELWEKTRARWKEVESGYPSRKAKQSAFGSRQKSYVKTYPPHLLAGGMTCQQCGGGISLVSGKGGGYYGCQNAAKKACSNKILLRRKRLEDELLRNLFGEQMSEKVISAVLEKVSDKIRECFGHIPEEIRAKRAALSQEEITLNNFIRFVGEGRAPASLAEAMSQSEDKCKRLAEEIESLEATKTSAFAPPPPEWITHRLKNLKELLMRKTEKSALLLRKLLGKIVLEPLIPEVGRPYYRVNCKLFTLALLDGSDKSSNSLKWWTRTGSNR